MKGIITMQKVTIFEWDGTDEEKIFKTFNRTTSMVSEDVKNIQEWMKRQPHLPEIMDDNSVKIFLISNKFSIELAKQKIDLYYTSLRKQYPELLRGINPRLSDMKNVFDAVYMLALPKLTDDMSRIYIYKVRNQEAERKLQHHHKNGHYINCMEICLKESLQLNETYIFDMSNTTIDSVKNFDPSIVLKMSRTLRRAHDFPIKAVYVVEPPPCTDVMLSFVKTDINPELTDRIHVCEKSDLLKHFPKRILPRNYGGEEKSLEDLNELMKQAFLRYQDRFDEIQNFQIDESLRPKLQNDELLGFYGSFRKLDLD